MKITESVQYRQKLAEGFLKEAEQDFKLERWRSCVDNSQLSVENSAKAVLAILGPVGRTHNPSVFIRPSLDQFPENVREEIVKIVEVSELLSVDIHIESDYGDEANYKTPWEIFDENAAKKAIDFARNTSISLQKIFQKLS